MTKMPMTSEHVISRSRGRIAAMGNMLDHLLECKVSLAVRGVSTLIEGYVASVGEYVVTLTEQPLVDQGGRTWSLVIEDILVVRTGEPLPKEPTLQSMMSKTLRTDPPDPDIGETFGSTPFDHPFVHVNARTEDDQGPLGARCDVCRVREAMHG